MIDWYTKSVLTVIGGALTVLAIGQLTTPARSQLSEPTKVQICGDLHCAAISEKHIPVGPGVVSTYSLAVSND